MRALFCSGLTITLVLCSWTSRMRAQESEAAEAIRPTVTAAEGDTGGTIFGQRPDPARTRQYFVAAESELWDYAPLGREELCGGPLPPQVARNRRAGKVRYIQYTDATFTTRVLPNRSLGILGPVLRGVVGDYLAITFLNRTDAPVSMHPHGVRYDKHSEGTYHLPYNGRGSAIGPNARFTYVWHLDEQSGPMPSEPSSKAWLYHSHVTGDAETNLGLIGAIIVTDPARARPDGTPRDVDREFATLFMIFDESGLDEAAREAAEYGNIPGLASTTPLSWSELQQATEAGARRAINGRLFGNLDGLDMNEGERTRWYLFGLGSEQDFHTAHWHGMRVVEEGRRRTDVVDLLPATMKVADLVADNPGNWLYHCHVAEHMREGMFARFTVHARDTVGVSREPADAFLGLPAATNSLRLDHARAVLNTGARPARADIELEGAVTVFAGFALHSETVRVAVGGRQVELKPGRNGVAEDPQVWFRAKNADEYGVVRDGVLQFELVLRGADWMRELETGTDGKQQLALTLEIARGRHTVRHAVTRDLQK